MYAPIIDLSLLLFWAFFITVKESPSISTNFNPKSLPSITVCKHATALATNPKETLLQRPPFCNYWTKDQITQMVQIKVWQISVLLFNTIQVNHSMNSIVDVSSGQTNFKLSHVSFKTTHSRKTCSLFSTPCRHLGQTDSLIINLLVLRFANVGR
ncbi:uncharacterized protein LOC108486492 [Gossypium arboreum]|uniref:uncharacterized protein LOC108486492 n=1 Tax=Gossypium arboreum TaxID=29729 RepID=UPI00081910EC|nr:uncharacterized protein LOC108486492 [Gossypium arboreum]